MAPIKKSIKKRSISLKSGRPPLSTFSAKKTSSQSSKHTRTLINKHHQLHKQLASAHACNDGALTRELEAQLEAQGGLEAYQLASRTGQSNERGGDSSRVLVEWLMDEVQTRRDGLKRGSEDTQALRILEVGALSTRNALNIPDTTKVRRIDLHSSEPGIEEVDFMDLELPKEKAAHSNERRGEWWNGGYDIISLSLVLNYVPDPKARGKMLRRTTKFFAQPSAANSAFSAEKEGTRPQLPCLFLVLPLPCVNNSRYLTTDHLIDIMQSLGYTNLHMKITKKLYYSLWRYRGEKGGRVVFKKRELVAYGRRNNFCIVLDE
jgi:25S rRNA (adenine2142-N1)-methyltransferase